MTSGLYITWRCGDGAMLTAMTDETVQLTTGTGAATLRIPSRRVTRALANLNRGVDRSALVGEICDDHYAAALLLDAFERLRRCGVLVADLWSDGGLLATLLPRSRSFDIDLPSKAAGTWQLSRFAYLRREGTHLVLESPEAPCAVVATSPLLCDCLHETARPVTPEPGSDKACLLALLEILGFMVDPHAEEGAAQQTWEFHDRLFYRHCRSFDDFRRRGGTYRFRGRFPSPPAIRSAIAGQAVQLQVPRSNPSRPLVEVMEERHSRRQMGSEPVRLDQVAALLYRVARLCGTLPSAVQDCLLRPYPSGGAIHELEFYLAVRECDGLAPGFYQYRGAEHALTKLEDALPHAEAMLADAACAWGRAEHPPQCLIVLTTRMPRLAWKYEGIAYKISLMNAGVVLQSLYLVCADLGLNCSAVGSGRPDLFTEAAKVSSWEETSIAEFGFGARPRTSDGE